MTPREEIEAEVGREKIPTREKMTIVLGGLALVACIWLPDGGAKTLATIWAFALLGYGYGHEHARLAASLSQPNEASDDR